jgi:hypothetical protein
MKNFVFGLILFVLISSQRCADQDYSKLLIKKWVHSYEEDSVDVTTYRPNDYKFPPSRGRRGMEFKPNGEFIRYDIAPSDGELPIYGKWETVKGKKAVQIRLTQPKAEAYQLEIVSVNENQLRVRKY